jgi:hypothetical protein
LDSPHISPHGPVCWRSLGEIVVLNDKGVPDFGALQNAFDAARAKSIAYFVFDAPFMGGFDMREVSLEGRRETLRGALWWQTNKFYSDFTYEARPSEEAI